MINITNINSKELINKKFDKINLDKIIIAFKKEGYCYLKDIFSKNLITELNLYFQENYKNYFLNSNNKYSTELSKKRYNITININDLFNNELLWANPLILEILNCLFTDKITISDIACVTSFPGAEKMRIHRDGSIFDGNPLNRLLPPHAIGLLIPLIPFTLENGTTRFWPGSHINNSSVGDFEKDPSFFDAEMDIGSCILVDYRLVHQGNANNSNEIRPLLYINYSAIWYFDQNTYQKQTPLKIDDENFAKIAEKYKPLFIRRNIYK